MRIKGPDPDPAFHRDYRGDLELLLRQPTSREARPCPGCDLVCPKCGSQSCNCNCSPDCEAAPGMLSSDPDEHPIEADIVPLVYALYSLRMTPPCWSCEGHYNRQGELDKLPRVWFYARSLAIPNLLAELLAEPRIAGKLSLPWHVCLVSWSEGIDVTFSVEPKVNPTDDPQLNLLRRDVRTIAESLEADMKIMSRHRISQLDKALGAARRAG